MEVKVGTKEGINFFVLLQTIFNTLSSFFKHLSLFDLLLILNKNFSSTLCKTSVYKV